MPDPVRISVVIPVHNAERYIEMTVRSALSSDLSELEILVVDDGSTDNSAKIVRQIGDPRVILIPLCASGGPARPRNIGIARASAPYVALLDADDLLKRDHLSAAVAALERHPEAGFAIGDFEKIDVEGRVLEASVHAGKRPLPPFAREPLGDSWHLITERELQRGLLDHNFIGTSGVVLRKGVLSEAGAFDETLVFAEDHDLWFRLAHRFSALYRDRIGHSLRIRPGSLTYQPTVRARQDRITVLGRERDRRESSDERKRLERMIAVDLANIGYMHRRRRERLRAAAAFARALAKHPNVPWMRALVGSLVRIDPTR
jgi:glycosyltransferase involved in cell wall biosynthesis